MTTKKFSAIKLPHPMYSVEFGSYDLEQKNLKLPAWFPRFIDSAHVIEVRKTGYLSPKGVNDDNQLLVSSFIMIEDARPELFIRRDFIKKFVNSGTIHLTQSGKDAHSSYQMYTVNNVLTITMSEKQYRRFGLITKRVLLNRATGEKRYQVEVDLTDEKIVSSNKKQDRLVQILRRLDPVKRLYLRFVPSKAETNLEEDPNDECLDFFKSVIDEYALDGFKPVPLTGCSKMGSTVQRKWLNCSQRHPHLRLATQSQTAESISKLYQNDGELLGGLLDIVDWLGYQLLSLDCDKEEIRCRYSDEPERLDVACKAIRGIIDRQQVEDELRRLFDRPVDDVTLFRALILYNCQGDSEKNVALLQDCSNESSSRHLSILGMSTRGR